jgi:tRNA-specific 2-thiouridylase
VFICGFNSGWAPVMADELAASSSLPPSHGRRVVVGMSGGVDSSTAAALLQWQGYEVIGVGLRLPLLQAGCNSPRRCCGPAAMEDARAVANQLGIRFAALDYQELFSREIVERFFRSYAEGRTPNPCAECNRLIKFGRLLEFARVMGADFLATGHYARTSRDPQSGRHLLLKGADREKDQSYFLYALSQEQLAAALFPLGAMTKDETRRLARSFGLPVSEKPGSQDICFLGEGDYRSLLAERHPESLQPGPIVDRRGRVLGTHKGVAGFTVGQRKSLGIAAGAPLYVLALHPATRAVVVGTKEELQQEKFTVAGINWMAFDPPPGSLEAQVKVRYRQAEQPAAIRLIEPGRAEVRWRTPQPAAAPGQSAVFYKGEVVLGGGIIE